MIEASGCTRWVKVRTSERTLTARRSHSIVHFPIPLCIYRRPNDMTIPPPFLPFRLISILRACLELGFLRRRRSYSDIDIQACSPSSGTYIISRDTRIELKSRINARSPAFYRADWFRLGLFRRWMVVGSCMLRVRILGVLFARFYWITAAPSRYHRCKRMVPAVHYVPERILISSR